MLNLNYAELKKKCLENNVTCLEQEYKGEKLITLSYNIDSPKNEFTQLCRGIVLDEDLNILAKPFSRFFNYGETEETLRLFNNDEPKVVLDKMDGSLMKLYYHPKLREWIVATKSTGVALNEVKFGITFRELFVKALINDPTLDRLDSYFIVETIQTFAKTENLDPHKTYLFELCSPLNQVVVRYNISIYFLAAYLNEINDTVSFESFNNPNIQYPKRYEFTPNILDQVKQLDGLRNEGYVVYVNNIPKIKVKSPDYVKLHHRYSYGLTSNIIIDLLFSYEENEWIAVLPDDAPILKPLIQKRDVFKTNCLELFAQIKELNFETKKDLALWINQYDKQTSSMLFHMLKYPFDFNIYTDKSKKAILGLS